MEIIVKSLIVIASAILGALATFTIKLNHDKLCALISFSAGALFGAAAFTLLPESFDELGYVELGLSVLSGYLVFWLISKYYSHVCPACSATHFDEKTTKKFSEIFLTLFTALAFHSFLDGVAISSGSDHTHGGGHSIFAAIAAHKFPEGLALAALMFGAGYKKGKILLYVILVEMTTLLGALFGLYVLQDGLPAFWMAFVMAHIAGGFLYLAVHAVLGEVFRHHKTLVISSFLLGTGLIYLVYVFVH